MGSLTVGRCSGVASSRSCTLSYQGLVASRRHHCCLQHAHYIHLHALLLFAIITIELKQFVIFQFIYDFDLPSGKVGGGVQCFCSIIPGDSLPESSPVKNLCRKLVRVDLLQSEAVLPSCSKCKQLRCPWTQLKTKRSGFKAAKSTGAIYLHARILVSGLSNVVHILQAPAHRSTWLYVWAHSALSSEEYRLELLYTTDKRQSIRLSLVNFYILKLKISPSHHNNALVHFVKYGRI